MRSPASFVAPIIGLALTAGGVAAQMPTTQPGILTIYIEEVKLGRQAEHEATEAGWPAAYEKSRSTNYYLALEAMTGTNEIWFVVPFESFAKEAETMNRDESDAALSAELARLSRTDAEYLDAMRTVQAIARPDLSYGAFPDLAKARFFDITTFRVRPGHDAEFEAAAKTYGQLAKRLAPEISYRVYQVSAGMPGGTYLIFSSVEDYAMFDNMLATDAKVFGGMTAKERAVMDTFGTQALISGLTNRFRLSPTMSFVAPETRAVDAAFWNRK